MTNKTNDLFTGLFSLQQRKYKVSLLRFKCAVFFSNKQTIIYEIVVYFVGVKHWGTFGIALFFENGINYYHRRYFVFSRKPMTIRSRQILTLDEIRTKLNSNVEEIFDKH